MNLQQWRTKKGLTMAQAASVLDVTQPTISRIESGEQLPGGSTIAKLSERSDGAINGADLYKHWETLQRGAA